MDLKKILGDHVLWLNGNGGQKADLHNADLRGANLGGADLRGANLGGADLREADLRGAKLSKANLRKANLRKTDLRYANLSKATLYGAGLCNADLHGANLEGVDLRYANLSKARLLTAQEWLKQFQMDDLGVLVFKRIGETEFSTPGHWTIEPGEFLTETVNPLPTLTCACGVNFGTYEWCLNNYKEADLWMCRIRWLDLASVVVPYNIDGKARCGRLELLEIVEEQDE